MSFKFYSLLIATLLSMGLVVTSEGLQPSDVYLSRKNSYAAARLLVGVSTEASFSPEELSDALGAAFLNNEARNVFRDLEVDFLDQPLLVLSEMPDIKIMGVLGVRYGYRFEVVGGLGESLEEAVNHLNRLLATNPRYASDLPRLSLSEAQAIYDLIGKFDKILTSNKLKYWAGRETLLGAIRHKGQIPWENGASFFILDQDRASFLNLAQEFEVNGLEIIPYFKGFYKVCFKEGASIPNVNKKGSFQPFTYPCADVFIVSLERFREHKDVYSHRAYDVYWNWNKDVFEYSQISRTLRVKFGPLKIFIPGDPEKYLDTFYGVSYAPRLWTKFAQEPWWNHRLEKCYPRNGASFVELDDTSCAPWE